jgi:hypothetical protein
VALIARRKEIVAETPNFRAREFRYYLSRASYQKEWGRTYQRPSFGTRVLAFFLKFVPKVGPFKALDFKIPTKQTEDLYIVSVDHTMENYTKLLREAAAGRVQLLNTDFDTGRDTRAGEYGLTDQDLCPVARSAGGPQLRPGSRPRCGANISCFLLRPKCAPIATKNESRRLAERREAEVERLRALPDSVPTIKTTSEVRSQDTARRELTVSTEMSRQFFGP